MGEQLHSVVWVLFVHGSFIAGALFSILLMRCKKEFFMDDDKRLDPRRAQGGAVFNELLHDLRGKVEKLKRNALTEMLDGATHDDRKRAYENVELCEEMNELILRMSRMRTPE